MINYPLYSALLSQIVSLFARITDRDFAGADFLLNDLSKVLGGTRLLCALEFARHSPVQLVNSSVLIAGQSSLNPVIKNCVEFVARYLSIDNPIIIIWISDSFALPKHYSEIEAVSLIELPEHLAWDRSALLHELGHCYLRSGHRMLDEGFAEWIATLGESEDASAALEKLEERARSLSDPRILARQRWENEPTFESLGLPPGVAHARAAFEVGRVICRYGIDHLVRLFERVRKEKLHDISSLLDFSCDASSESDLRDDSQPSVNLDLALCKRSFLVGDITFARNWIEEARSRSNAFPNCLRSKEAYLRLLFVLGDTVSSDELEKEIDCSLDEYLKMDDTSGLAYALCIVRQGFKVRRAKNLLDLNDAFLKGRKICAAALQEHPEDLDVIVSAAKYEMYTPREYGGNHRLALELMAQAATLTSDEAVARKLLSWVSDLRERQHS